MSYTGNIKIYGKTHQSSNQVPGNNVQTNNIRVVTSGSSNIIGHTAQRKQVADGKRLGILERTQIEEVYPPVVIHRVDSSEHRQKVKPNEVSSSYNQNLTNSLYARPNMGYVRSDARNMSTSVDKTGSGTYLTPKFDYYSSNQSDTNRASYKINAPTYKNETNNLVTYGGDSETGSNDGQYKGAGYVNQRLDNLGISNRMVSSIISRQSNEKLEGTYPVKSKQTQVYQLYSSRHPNQSIRRSTIQISKAMSQNAIAQLERQNEHKEKKIKKLQKEKEHFQSNTQKWEDIKHRYQMDLQSKSRQIIDLQRANKRLVEEVQGIRAYRTMDTVEQVIIVRLKQQIMELNKKIIEMRTEHYRNQQQLIEKHQKKQAMVKTKIQAELTDKQKLKKLQGQFDNKIKQIQFLGVELQKQKQKSWSLQKERQQFSAEIATSKQALQKQSSYLKKQVITLKQEVQEKFQAMRSKDFQIEDLKRHNEEQLRKINERAGKQLQQQKRTYQNQLNSKVIEIQKITEQLSQKQKQAEQKIQQQKNILQRQLAEQSKKTESKVAQEQQNKQLLQRLRQEKEQGEEQLKSKIAEMEQNLRNTNQRISQKDQQLFSILNKDKDMQRVIGQYQTEIEHLKRIIGENETFFRDLQSQNQMIKAAINERNAQIEHLRIDNMQIVQNLNREVAEKQNIISQQVSRSESIIKSRMQAQFKQKQRQLEAKLAQFNSLEQNMKQEKQKIEQQQQQQQQNARLQAEQKEKEKKENQKWRAEEMGRIQSQIKSKLETQFKQKQRQLQSRIASVNTLQKNVQQEQKNIKQLQSRLEQEKQAQLQQQLAQQQVNQKSQSESRDRELKERQKWMQDEYARMQAQISSHLSGQFGHKQQQLINQIGWLEQNVKEMQFRLVEQQQHQSQVENEQRINNQKWKQEEVSKIETQIRNKLEGQLKQKQKQLQTKISSVNLMEQNLKQVKTKAQQQQKGQVQKEQNSIRELQAKRNSLTEQVKKLETALATINKQTTQITSKKAQLQSQLGLKQRQLKEIQAKNTQTRVQLQASLVEVSNLQNQKRQIGGQVQRLRDAQNTQKEVYNKEQQAKNNSLTQQVNNLRGEYAKLQQLFKQNEAELHRRIEIQNALKSKTENLQANSNLLKSNLANLQNQKEEFKKKIKQHEDSKASRMETLKKYEQLLPEHEMMKQKLKLREDQITGRQTAYSKLKQYTESTETKVASLSKQLRAIQAKIDDNEGKFRVLLNKTEQQQFQYKSLYEKMVNDTQTYVEFIKELQQQNEFLAQKYWKVRKLVRKQKLTEDHEIPERRQYGVFYKFLENQLTNHFSKVIFPAFKSKMSQKLSEVDSRLITQYRKIIQAKSEVQYAKRRRAAERARSHR